jgi:peptidoglycan/LPS O-acetylase OafA/YrhL
LEADKKVNSLILLRGISVLCVCFCHFGQPLTKNNTMGETFSMFHEYGQYGVRIFFVISGFIIPLSMDKAKYKIKHYFSFLFKRAVRLHPPYLAALALTLIIVVVSDRVKHIAFPENMSSIIQSLFYLHIPDNNPVFWTLRIEAEYYAFIGLLFPLLNNFPKLFLCIALPLMMIISQTDLAHDKNLFAYIAFFLMGIVTYLIYNKVGPFLLALICLITLIVFSFIFYPWPSAIAGLFTASFILLYKARGNGALNFFGEISYSIYLIHFPIGVKLVNLIFTHLNPRYYVFLFLVTIILVSAISAIFWKFIEKPFADLSNKIKYGQSRKSPKSLAPSF